MIGHRPVRVKARQLATLPPGNSGGNFQKGMESGASFGSGHRRHKTLPKMDGVRNHLSDCFYKVALISVKKGWFKTPRDNPLSSSNPHDTPPLSNLV